MKKVGIIVAIVLAFLALGGGIVHAAQDSLPGDTLYSVKLTTEELLMSLPGNDVARAARGQNFADRRVEEIVQLATQGRVQDLGLAVDKYDYAMDMALARIEGAGVSELAGNITAVVAAATSIHLQVLADLYEDEQVPAQAKPGLEQAMSVSARGHVTAVEALNGMGIQVPPLEIPKGMPQWIEEMLGGLIPPPQPGAPDGPPTGQP